MTVPSIEPRVEHTKTEDLASFPQLAAVHYHKGFDIDQLLVDACSSFSSLNLRVGGLVQIAAGGPGLCATSVYVRDLRTGETFDIWEERGQPPLSGPLSKLVH